MLRRWRPGILGQAVRDVVIGIMHPDTKCLRWLLVNALPLPVGPALGPNPRRARIVTTFADITDHFASPRSQPPMVDGLPVIITRLLCFGRWSASSCRHDRLLLGK